MRVFRHPGIRIVGGSRIGLSENQLIVNFERDLSLIPTARQLERLKVASRDQVAHRKVSLMLGDLCLAKAHNWYVPERLTPEINFRLVNTTVPFGRLVRELSPHRQTFQAECLWKTSDPCTPWVAGELCGRIASASSSMLVHRALLLNVKAEPLAEVCEIFQKSLVTGLSSETVASELRLRRR